MKVTVYQNLAKTSQVYILKQMRDIFNFPIGCLLEVQATDETKDKKPVIMIRKVERKEGK